MTLSTQLDIAALTDAWNAGDYTGILAPYIEIHPFGRRPTPLIHTSIWLLIQDENDRREHEAQQAKYDMKARALGYRDWPAVLRDISRKLDKDQGQEAADLYRAVVK